MPSESSSAQLSTNGCRQGEVLGATERMGAEKERFPDGCGMKITSRAELCIFSSSGNLCESSLLLEFWIVLASRCASRVRKSVVLLRRLESSPGGQEWAILRHLLNLTLIYVTKPKGNQHLSSGAAKQMLTLRRPGPSHRRSA